MVINTLYEQMQNGRTGLGKTIKVSQKAYIGIEMTEFHLHEIFSKLKGYIIALNLFHISNSGVFTFMKSSWMT